MADKTKYFSRKLQQCKFGRAQTMAVDAETESDKLCGKIWEKLKKKMQNFSFIQHLRIKRKMEKKIRRKIWNAKRERRMKRQISVYSSSNRTTCAPITKFCTKICRRKLRNAKRRRKLRQRPLHWHKFERMNIPRE